MKIPNLKVFETFEEIKFDPNLVNYLPLRKFKRVLNFFAVGYLSFILTNLREEFNLWITFH